MNLLAGNSTNRDESAPQPSGLWHRPRPSVAGTTAPVLFYFSILVLGGVAMGAMTWGASSLLAQKGSEKLLRTEVSLPKLKSNHGTRKADAFRTSEPESSEWAYPKERTTPEPAPLPPLVTDQPKVTIAPPRPSDELPRVVLSDPSLHPVELTVETCSDPVVYVTPQTLHRGETPMMRNWKTLTMYSLLSAAAVTLAPSPIVFADDKKAPIEEKKAPAIDGAALLEGLRAEIKKLENGPLADLAAKVKGVGDDVLDIKKSVDKLKSEVGSLQTSQLSQKLQLDHQKKELELLADEVRSLRKKLLADGGPPPTDKAALEEMVKTMKAIQEAIAKLHANDTSKRIALSPPETNAATAGKVMLQNFYTEELLFVVNNVGYRVPAGKSRLVENLPLGTVQYLVHSDRWGPLQNRSTTLTAAQNTFTVTANNPR